MSRESSPHYGRVQNMEYVSNRSAIFLQSGIDADASLSLWTGRRSNASEQSGVTSQGTLNLIRAQRLQFDQQCQHLAMVGALITVGLVAALSLHLHMPVQEQYARIVAAAFVLGQFWMLMYPMRGLPTFLLGGHLMLSLNLIGIHSLSDGFSAVGQWDLALLATGLVAAALCWRRDYRQAVLRNAEINQRLSTYSERVRNRVWLGNIG